MNRYLSNWFKKTYELPTYVKEMILNKDISKTYMSSQPIWLHRGGYILPKHMSSQPKDLGKFGVFIRNK